MASLGKHPQIKGSYRLQFKHPYRGWIAYSFKDKAMAEQQKATWEYIEMLVATGQKFDHLLQDMGEIATVGKVLDAYTRLKMKNFTNKKTVMRYNNVIDNIIEVFGADQHIKTLRESGRNGYEGWEWYKEYMMRKGRVKRGINTDLNMARVIFNWAMERNKIHNVVITKSDFFTDTELEAIKFKIWTKAEIRTLFTHPDLTEFQKDLIHVYTMLGVRAREILGKNNECPGKSLLWEHVDFDESILYISPKRVKGRKAVYMPESVRVIFEKWRGYPMPLDFEYSTLRKHMVRIANTTGIKFTCHDLRRLHAQIVERQTGNMQKVATSIGDKSVDVAEKHYAGVSLNTQRDISEDYISGLNDILSNVT